MKHIIYIGPSIRVKGGISTVQKQIINSRLAADNKIFLVSSHVDGSKISKLIQAIAGLIKTALLLVCCRIDIVHIHGSDIMSSSRKYLFYKLCRCFRCKIIYHFHGASFEEQYQAASTATQKRLKVLFEGVDHVLCLSESWKQTLHGIAPSARITVVPNGIEIPEQEDQTLSKSGVVNILFLGLIGERKGVFDLLKAFKRLLEEGLEVKLYIGGNGEISRLEEMINTYDISQHVDFLGWVGEEQKKRLFSKSDIYALPSYGEGMPMSILEAMSYGVPVVSTFVGGIPRLIKNHENGILIEPGDTDALYEALRMLLLKPELRKKIGKESVKTIKNDYMIDDTIRKIETVYHSLN